MNHNIDESMEGYSVVNASGDEIGIVKDVRNGTAYVDPDPGLTDSIRSKLGWNDPDAKDFPLGNDRIDRIDGDEIHLTS